MADEQFYLQVELEIEEGTKDIALWSKAKIIAEDNNTEAQLEYTKLRVEQLRQENIKEKTEKVVEALQPYKGVIWFAIIIAIIAFISWMT